MTNEHYELVRTDSICCSPEEELLGYVLKEQVNDIKEMLKRYDPATQSSLVNYRYEHPYQKPLLYIAITEQKEKSVAALLGEGADPHYSQPGDFQKEAVHYAALSGNVRILKTVLEHVRPEKLNATTVNGETALISLAKGPGPSGTLECVRVLVERGMDVNKTDKIGMSAVLWAAKLKQKKLFEALLSAPKIDLDSHEDRRGRTARDLAQENVWFDLNLPARVGDEFSKRDGVEVWFDCLKRGDELRFLLFQDFDANAQNESHTLLQLACEKNLPNAVQHLLSNGADQLRATEKNPKTPIEIVAKAGYYRLFEMLLERQNDIPGRVLLELIKRIGDAKFDFIDHERCYNQLMQKPVKVDINSTDDNKSVPLHYAVRYGGVDHVLQLLQKRASLACRNDFGQLAIEHIDPGTLKAHFDSCIDIGKDGSNYELTITFDYASLVPPKPIGGSVIDRETSDSDIELQKVPFIADSSRCETDVVDYISQDKELRPLLIHPLITSFLYLKWYRIRWLFYTNLIFYAAFCMSLILYIFVTYTNKDLNTTVSLVLYSALLATFVLVLLRELFQLAISPKRYIFNFENWIEVAILILTAFILIQETLNDNVSKQLVAVVIVLAAFELVLLFGQHPGLSTYVVMLRTVSYNFMKFLLWYSVLIIAFALSFYILFNDNGAVANDGAAATDDGNSKNETDFFDDPGNSILKTIVMLTGEFDASDIKFETYPLTSRIIFLVFVLTISIILFNLLNGLAVSDTQMIKNDAEIVGHVARIQHIAYIERMLSGNLLPSDLLRKCCCFPFLANGRRLTVHKSLMERVCLFPKFLPDYKLKVFPYTKQTKTEESHGRKDAQFICLDKKTLKSAFSWWREAKQSDNSLQVMVDKQREALQKIAEDLNAQQKQFAELRTNQKLLMSKLELLCNNLNNNT